MSLQKKVSINQEQFNKKIEEIAKLFASSKPKIKVITGPKGEEIMKQALEKEIETLHAKSQREKLEEARKFLYDESED